MEKVKFNQEAVKEIVKAFNDKAKEIAEKWISYNKCAPVGQEIIAVTLNDKKDAIVFYTCASNGITIQNVGCVSTKYLDDDLTLEIDAKKYFEELEKENQKNFKELWCEHCRRINYSDYFHRMW